MQMFFFNPFLKVRLSPTDVTSGVTFHIKLSTRKQVNVFPQINVELFF